MEKQAGEHRAEVADSADRAADVERAHERPLRPRRALSESARVGAPWSEATTDRSRLRVGAIVHAYPPGRLAGAERMLESILEWLTSRGHDCRVCTACGPYTRNGVRVAEDVHDLDGCDVVFTHLHRSAEASRLCAQVPLVQIIHFDDATVEEWNAPKCDLTVHNTHWLGREMPREPSVTLHPPTFPEAYETTPGTDITIVNLTFIKGAPFFWELAARMPDTKFLAVKGGYGDQILQSLANVEIIDPVDDMRSAYARTRILLMPSISESYGRCGVEAAMSGIPTIATRMPGVVEALGDSGTYPAMRTEAWEAAIRGMDWDERSARARAHARSLDPEGELLVLEQALWNLATRAL